MVITYAESDSVLLLPMIINGRRILKVVLGHAQSWHDVRKIIVDALSMMTECSSPCVFMFDTTGLDSTSLEKGSGSCLSLIQELTQQQPKIGSCVIIATDKAVVKFITMLNLQGLTEMFLVSDHSRAIRTLTNLCG